VILRTKAIQKYLKDIDVFNTLLKDREIGTRLGKMILSLENFLNKKRPGLVWEDLTTAQRDIKSNTYNSYVYEKAKSKAIPKNYIPFNELLKKLNVKKDSFKEYESNRKGNYGDLQKKIKEPF
jgi:hypothetical protein